MFDDLHDPDPPKPGLDTLAPVSEPNAFVDAD